MTSPRPQPFRAGFLPGEALAAPDSHIRAFTAEASTAVTLLADVSEFQRDIEAAYLKWSKAIIVRAAYGDAHDDHAWFGGARRDFLHEHGIRYLGLYQYLVAGQDPVAQAKAFCRLVGSMRPGEDLYADIEEGTGNLQRTWVTWANVVHGELGWAPKDYSGEFFAREHGLAPVRWVAAYGQREPSEPHDLWQFTSSFQIPGVGQGDCSVAHKSIDQLAAMAYQGKASPPPTRPADPVLRAGATGPAVAVMQNRLNAWHASPQLTADGGFGPMTTAALRRFQSAQHLATDAVCGPATWTALHRTPTS